MTDNNNNIIDASDVQPCDLCGRAHIGKFATCDRCNHEMNAPWEAISEIVDRVVEEPELILSKEYPLNQTVRDRTFESGRHYLPTVVVPEEVRLLMIGNSHENVFVKEGVPFVTQADCTLEGYEIKKGMLVELKRKGNPEEKSLWTFREFGSPF